MNPDLSVVILTQNEEANIDAAVGSVVPWAAAIYVVDSFSDDRTADIAEALGARVFEHRFDHWADQRNWALQELPIATPWVFFLDADEWVPRRTQDEIDATLAGAVPEIAGVRVRFDYRFLGRSIRRSFDSHAVIRIVRPDRALWRPEGAREYCALKGEILDLEELVMHEDRKPLSMWIDKQRRNAEREALGMIAARARRPSRTKQPTERKVRAWLRRNVYDRMPLFIRPFAYFIYRYFFRLAFLEGRPGFVYTVLHGFWYHFLVDAIYYECRYSAPSHPCGEADGKAVAKENRVLHDAPAS